jgi:hypothetical protein
MEISVSITLLYNDVQRPLSKQSWQSRLESECVKTHKEVGRGFASSPPSTAPDWTNALLCLVLGRF